MLFGGDYENDLLQRLSVVLEVDKPDIATLCAHLSSAIWMAVALAGMVNTRVPGALKSFPYTVVYSVSVMRFTSITFCPPPIVAKMEVPLVYHILMSFLTIKAFDLVVQYCKSQYGKV